MISGDNLHVLDDVDEAVEKFWNILPFLQFDLRNRMLHVSKEDKLVRMRLVKNPVELTQEMRYLARDMYSLMRKGHLPAQVKVCDYQDPFLVLLQKERGLVSHWFDCDPV